MVDLVVTDLRMPVLSGDAVVSAVKQINNELPVIVMSGHASGSDLELLRARGADAFIPKPFTPDQLTKAMDSLAVLREKTRVHARM